MSSSVAAQSALMSINQNTFMVGAMMLCLNLGGKYLSLHLTKSQEDFLAHVFMRYIVLFAVVFIATRNVLTSFVMTLVFIVITRFLLNEQSIFCIIPMSIRKLSDEVEENVTDGEIEHAKRVLEKAKAKDNEINTLRSIHENEKKQQTKNYKNNLALLSAISYQN